METKTVKKNWKQSKLAKWLLALAAALLTYFVLEGGVRLYLWIKTKDPNVAMYWKVNYEPYVIAASNDRMHRPWPPKSDKLRILIIGGSTADCVPDEAVIAAFRKSGREIEVVNLANRGFIVNQEIVTLSLYGIPLKPDLLISLDGANDVIQFYQTDRPGVPYTDKYVRFAVDHPILNVFFGIFRNSQLMNMAFKFKERTLGKAVVKDARRQEETLAGYLRGRDTITSIAAGLKIPYIAVLQPFRPLCGDYAPRSPGEKEDFLQNFKVEMYRRLIGRLDVATFPDHVFPVDGTLLFKTGGQKYFLDGVHLTPEGSVLLMDYIYEQAAQKGWRPAAAR